MRKGSIYLYLELVIFTLGIFVFGIRLFDVIKGEPCDRTRFIVLIVAFISNILFLIYSFRKLITPRK